MNDERERVRPAGNGADPEDQVGAGSEHQASAPAGTLRHDPIPTYGTDEYHALPADDPRRHLAIWRAAEAWRQQFTPEAVHARLVAEDREVVRRLRQMSHDLADGEWSGPWWDHLQVTRRRARLLNNRPDTVRDPDACLASWEEAS